MTKFTLEIEIDGERVEAAKALDAAIESDALQEFFRESGNAYVDRATVAEEKSLGETLTRFTVEVEIDGDRAEAAEALDDALDACVLQDAINNSGDVTVETAVVVNVQPAHR